MAGMLVSLHAEAAPIPLMALRQRLHLLVEELDDILLVPVEALIRAIVHHEAVNNDPPAS